MRMRADVKPYNDNRVRLVLKRCQNREKILKLAHFGEGVLGHDIHVSPAHPDFCEMQVPKYDPERARQLLREAGFRLTIDAMPGSKYCEQWTKVDLGITQWAHRPLGTMVLGLGCVGDADGKPVAWNEAHWVDREFDELFKQASGTFDVNKRKAIM